MTRGKQGISNGTLDLGGHGGCTKLELRWVAVQCMADSFGIGELGLKVPVVISDSDLLPVAHKSEHDRTPKKSLYPISPDRVQNLKRIDY